MSSPEKFSYFSSIANTKKDGTYGDGIYSEDPYTLAGIAFDHKARIDKSRISAALP